MPNPADKQTVFQGRVITVNIENARLPGVGPVPLEIVRHPGGAAVVALNERHEVCLLRQYRHAAGGYILELPAGKLEPGEPPLDTAQRELVEEAGVAATHWRPLGAILSSPGVFTEVIHLYLAQDLQVAAMAHEAHEVIEVQWWPFAKALRAAHDGRIADAKTLIGLFRAAALAGEERA